MNKYIVVYFMNGHTCKFNHTRNLEGALDGDEVLSFTYTSSHTGATCCARFNKDAIAGFSTALMEHQEAG